MLGAVRKLAIAAACLPCTGNKAEAGQFNDLPVPSLAQIYFNNSNQFARPGAYYYPSENPRTASAKREELGINTYASEIAAGIIALGVCAVAFAIYSESKKSARERYKNFKEFEQFFDELQAFNNIHTKVPGLINATVNRSGRAAAHEGPHDEALLNEWRVFLDSIGLVLDFHSEYASHRDGTECQYYTRGSLRVQITKADELRKLVRVVGEEMKKLPESGWGMQNALRVTLDGMLEHLESAVEAGILTAIRESQEAELSEFFSMQAYLLEQSFVDAGSSNLTKTVRFYRELRRLPPPTLSKYEAFHRACRNQNVQDSTYVIYPHDLAIALKTAEWFLERTPGNNEITPFTRQVLKELDVMIAELSQSSFLAPQSDHDDDEEGRGGVSAIEEKRRMPISFGDLEVALGSAEALSRRMHSELRGAIRSQIIS